MGAHGNVSTWVCLGFTWPDLLREKGGKMQSDGKCEKWRLNGGRF